MRATLLSIYILLVTFLGATAQTPAVAQKKSILIKGATVHVGNGQIIENAAVGFKDGKLTLVVDGSKKDIPAFDETIDATGKHIYPGFIAPNITIGLQEVESVRATRDFSEAGNINPNVRAGVAYNTDSKIIPTVRTNGILLAQSTPRYGLISGTSSVMMLDGWNWEDAAYRMDDGIHVNFPRMMAPSSFDFGGPSDYKKNENYDKLLNELKTFFENAKAYNEVVNHEEKNLKFEAMRGVFTGAQNLYVNANSAKEIEEAIAFVKQFGIKKPVLVGGDECYLVADLMKSNNIPVILSRVHRLPASADEDVDLPYKIPSLLQKAGVLFCLGNDGDMEVMGARNLPFQAGTTAAYGLTKEEALSSITFNTAKILGVDKTTGTIEAGKDANLFISSGDALDMRTNNVEKAFIKGKNIDLNNSQKDLYNKYKQKYELK